MKKQKEEKSRLGRSGGEEKSVGGREEKSVSGGEEKSVGGREEKSGRGRKSPGAEEVGRTGRYGKRAGINMERKETE